MKKLVLIILLVCAASAMADSDTLLTVRQYGYRTFGFMNIPDTVNGNDLIDSAAMSRYVNMAFSEIALLVSSPKEKLIPTAKGQRWYLVDDGLIYIRDVAAVANGVLAPMSEVKTLQEAFGSPLLKNRMKAGDTLSLYYTHGDSIMFLPIPDRTDTAMVTYYARPAHPNGDTGVVNIPYEYKNAMIYTTAYLAEMSRRGPYADAYKAMSEAEIARLVGRKTETWKTQ